MGLEIGLVMKPAFRFMNQLGTAEALRLVKAYADAHVSLKRELELAASS